MFLKFFFFEDLYVFIGVDAFTIIDVDVLEDGKGNIVFLVKRGIITGVAEACALVVDGIYFLNGVADLVDLDDFVWINGDIFLCCVICLQKDKGFGIHLDV